MPPRSGVACLFMRVGAWCLVLPSIPGGLSLTVRMAGALKAANLTVPVAKRRWWLNTPEQRISPEYPRHQVPNARFQQHSIKKLQQTCSSGEYNRGVYWVIELSLNRRIPDPRQWGKTACPLWMWSDVIAASRPLGCEQEESWRGYADLWYGNTRCVRAQ